MSDFDSDEFKALQAKWYKKLASTPDKSGEVFKDIEDNNREDKPLKSWHNHRFKLISVEERLGIESYYEQAKQLLNSYKFKNSTHRRIWELHCDGISNRQIANKIKGLTPTYKHSKVDMIILEIAKTFKGSTHASRHT